MQFKTICMMGLGYIGLPTAAVLSSQKKIKVIGVDINPRTVETINSGKVHISEPDLEQIVKLAVEQGYLRAEATPERADAFLIAVPTPFKDTDHEPDLSYIASAVQAIAPFLVKGNLVVLESTSPVGTTEKIAAWLAEARPDLSFPQTAGEASDIRIAYCPERVLPGKIIQELVTNDRIIGGMTRRCSEAACSLYGTFIQGKCLSTNARTAEMIKLTENSFRDVNIAFANELSIICDQLDINVWELISLANRHPRVNILQPGPGVGGHCIAVDPWFIVNKTPDSARLIRAAREVNDSKPAWVCKKVEDMVREVAGTSGKSPADVAISCFGLTFKANVDDLRESPALNITLNLAKCFPGQVTAVEPHVEACPDILQNAGVNLVSFKEALISDVLVILVNHDEFAGSEFHVKGSQRILDTRGILNKLQ